MATPNNLYEHQEGENNIFDIGCNISNIFT